MRIHSIRNKSHEIVRGGYHGPQAEKKPAGHLPGLYGAFEGRKLHKTDVSYSIIYMWKPFILPSDSVQVINVITF